MRQLNTHPLIGIRDPGLTNALREQATLVNLLAQGRASARASAATAPTAGAYAQGDIVQNSSPTEEGSAGARYVVLGWVCVGGGDPATFVPFRASTGN